MPLEERGPKPLSNCSLPSSGMFGYGLLLREDFSASVRGGDAHMQDLLWQYVETWGDEPNEVTVPSGSPDYTGFGSSPGTGMPT